MDVVLRWMALYPPRGSDRKPLKVTDEFLKLKADNAAWVATTRKRLSSLGWFMKCLKEPLARMANKQDGFTGAFFEGRSAGIVALPEKSPHTSIKERVEHVKATGRIADVSEIRNGSVAATAVADGLERDLWLIPIEFRRKQGALREGMREGFTLGQYLMLVDYTSRLVRDGKAVVTKRANKMAAKI